MPHTYEFVKSVESVAAFEGLNNCETNRRHARRLLWRSTLTIRTQPSALLRTPTSGNSRVLPAGVLILLFCVLEMAGAPEARFERLGPFGGTVRSLLINSRNRQIVYLGTGDGQIFKSVDGGLSWNLLYPGIGRRQIVLDTIVEAPTDPDHLLVGGWDLRSDGGGLFESRDAGRTWRQVPLPKRNAAVRGIAISARNPSHIVVGTLSGVFISADGGRTWRQAGGEMEAFRKVESVAIDPGNPRLLYVGTWHLGYRSSDAGRTWTRNDRGMIPDSDVFSLAVDPGNPAVIYASACTGIYRSENHGSSWNRLKIFPSSFLVRAHLVCLDPADSTRLYGGTTEGLFSSVNSGRTWNRITRPDLTIHAIQIDPGNSKRILIGTELRGVMRSEDGGHTWTDSNRGFVNRSIARVVPDLETQGCFVVGENSEGRIGGYHIYDNPINGWISPIGREFPGEGLLSLVNLPANRGRIAGTARGAFLQRPGSDGWVRLTGPIGKLSVYDLTLHARNLWVYAGTNDGVYRARVEDLSFQKPYGYRFIPRVLALLAGHGDPDRIYAATHMGVLRSDDAGASWVAMTGGIPDHTNVQSLAASPIAEGHLFAGTTSGLYESLDGGKSWRAAGDSRLGGDISAVITLDASGSRVAAADNSSGGIFLSEDGGAHWTRIENSEFGSPVRSLVQDPRNPSVLYLGTGTEGLYRLTLPLPESQVSIPRAQPATAFGSRRLR